MLNDNNFSILMRSNISEVDFYSQRDTYNFIKQYTKTYGDTPSPETVAIECESFDYQGEVADHYSYLIKSIKNATAKRKAFTLLQDEAGVKFTQLQGIEFVNWLHTEVDNIKRLVDAETGIGTNFATNGKERLEQYLARKEGKTNQYIPTPYRSLTKWLNGGWEIGDYVLLFAYLNKGKSWDSTDIGVCAWRNGFGVIQYSPELSKQQTLDRIDTLNGNYNNTEIKLGNLSNEEDYFNYLRSFNDTNDTPYLVKTMGDLNKGLSLDVIEADLQANPDIKMAIIDGFNLMTHKGKGSNRDNMSNTSRQLRQLFAKYGVVGIVVHQAPTSAERNKEEDETGIKVVRPPEVYEYSETVSVVQDACTVITFDQVEGVGKLKLAKSRTPNVGKELDLHCNFNLGKITEVTVCDFI